VLLRFSLYRLARSPALLSAINGTCLAWGIAAVEFTLVWNHVVGVYDIKSTGQITPFVIGIVGLCRALLALSVKSSAIRHTDILMVGCIYSYCM
jgi:hypothetical protein